MFYCEIDENGICYHVTKNAMPLSERIILSEEAALGMKYRSGGWEKVAEPEEEPRPTTEELLTEVLLSAEYTACLLEEQMENA